MTTAMRSAAKTVAVVFVILSIMESVAPGWNGFLREAANVTPGEGRIISTLYLIGAALLWFR